MKDQAGAETIKGKGWVPNGAGKFSNGILPENRTALQDAEMVGGYSGIESFFNASDRYLENKSLPHGER